MPRLMGHLTVAAVGKVRARHWRTAQEEYLKRLNYYTNATLIETKDVAGRGIPDSVALQREGETLLQAAESAAFKIALTPTGKQMTSPELAEWLQVHIERYSRLAFLVGGPLGFAPELLTSCHTQLSLSPLTFPHELARIILLEQLYRAFTIIHREQYHK